jgi:uncharacterized protein (TIGR03067 family)
LIKRWLRIDQPRPVLDKESQRLQGTWQVTSGEEGGVQIEQKIMKYVRWTFDEDELATTKARTINNSVVCGKGGTVISTYKVTTDGICRVLNVSTISPVYGEEHQAIYELNGNVLRVCMKKTDGLPNDFTAGTGSGCILLTLKKLPER